MHVCILARPEISQDRIPDPPCLPLGLPMNPTRCARHHVIETCQTGFFQEFRSRIHRNSFVFSHSPPKPLEIFSKGGLGLLRLPWKFTWHLR